VTPPFTPEEIERAHRYHRPLYLAAVAAIALDLVVLSLLAFGPLGTKLYGVTDGLPWWGRAFAFAALVLTVTTLVELPLRYWAGYRHEHEWDFSTQTRRAWAIHRLKGFMIGLVLGCAWLVGLIAAAHAWPDLWPIPVGLAAAGLVLVLGFLAPLLLEPLFNRFRPLEDAGLASSLLALADRAGVPIRHVLVADASRRTRKVNAYVSGIGRSRRVVVFDTLLREATSPELHLVVAHELGHRRKQHVAKGTVLGMLGAAGFVFVIWALLESSGLRSAIGVGGAGDPRVVPFLLLVASALGLLASPFGSALSRRWERQADAFSLELTHDTEAFVSTHHRLALANLTDLDPPRLAYLAWSSHPTPPERIASASG
jgi:STE24 endopeptidase